MIGHHVPLRTYNASVLTNLPSGTIGKALRLTLAILAFAGPTAPAASAVSAETQTVVLELDPGKTDIQFTLDGALHATHGTFKLERGAVTVEPATGKAEGLIVVGASSGDSGNRARDERMKESILETGRYPSITFSPQRVDGHREPDGDFQAKVTGILLLHGTEHQVVLDTQGHVSGQRLTATCQFSIPYVEWGLTDPSFLFLRVAQLVEIHVIAEGQVTWMP
jgi:polyisoprenoid-binding protein YceI